MFEHSTPILLGGGALVGGLVAYLMPVIKGYREMSDRAALFAKSSFVLRGEKRALLENLDEGVITVGGGGRISYVNLRAESFLGIQGESLLGKLYDDGSIGNMTELWRESKALIAKAIDMHDRVHTSIVLSEIQKIHLELVAIPAESGKGIVLLMQDRSNQKKILEMGKDFVANASHELRTPVTIIRGFAETLRDLPEVSEEMYESILEKIIRNCERMEQLVKNLLMLSDLDNMTRGRMKECDLVHIIEESCNQCLAAFPTVQIERLTNKEHVLILGDASLIELSIFNLLKNAVKYSPSPAEIQITIDSGTEEVALKIQDKGIGIPEEELEKIFNRFYTVDKAHSRKLGGAGLGLSIVRLIVEKHDGRISASSEKGEGTTLHLNFPIL